MNDKEQAAHYTILRNLYSLYDQNKNNAEALDMIAGIAWSLGVDLNLDYGYHELAELAQGAKAGSSDGAQHYTDIIEQKLAELKG